MTQESSLLAWDKALRRKALLSPCGPWEDLSHATCGEARPPGLDRHRHGDPRRRESKYYSPLKQGTRAAGSWGAQGTTVGMGYWGGYHRWGWDNRAIAHLCSAGYYDVLDALRNDEYDALSDDEGKLARETQCAMRL